jgi:hypothetical protein
MESPLLPIFVGDVGFNKFAGRDSMALIKCPDCGTDVSDAADSGLVEQSFL